MSARDFKQISESFLMRSLIFNKMFSFNREKERTFQLDLFQAILYNTVLVPNIISPPIHMKSFIGEYITARVTNTKTRRKKKKKFKKNTFDKPFNFNNFILVPPTFDFGAHNSFSVQ